MSGGGEGVAVVVNGGLGAGNDTAVEGGGATHVNLETAVARAQAALLGDALVVAVDFCAAGVEAGGGLAADQRYAEACATAGVAFVMGGAVLQAFNGQVAADVGGDLGGADHGTFEGGVAAAVEDDLVACANLGIVEEGAVTVAVALGAAGIQVEGKAIRANAQANTATAAVVAVVLGDAINAGQQVDILGGVEL